MRRPDQSIRLIDYSIWFEAQTAFYLSVDGVSLMNLFAGFCAKEVVVPNDERRSG